MYATLREVRNAARDQLDGQVKLCADRVRDLSGSLCKAVACGKGNCTVTEVSRKDSRYVALNILMRAITVDTQAVQRHRVSILECVKDVNASIRERALELVYLLVNDTNVKLLTKELVDYLRVDDPDFKEDLTAKICSIAEKLVFLYLGGFPVDVWHV
ncbi:AP-1 complex subunit gamma-1 [Hordeum vulgare]|nr:AP-1 complex subunit gamma-1 [Hordeum vulgare]